MDLSDLERRAVASSLALAMLRNEMRVVASRTGIETTELVFPELAGGAAAEYEGPEDKWNAGPAIAIGIPVFDWGQARTAPGRPGRASCRQRQSHLGAQSERTGWT